MSGARNAVAGGMVPAPVWVLQDWKWCPKCGARWSGTAECDSCEFNTAHTSPACATAWSVPENPWYAAVTDACVSNNITWSETDARLSLVQLVAWESQLALDPAVSKEAQGLLEQGRREAIARAGQSAAPGLVEVLRAIGAWHRRMNKEIAGKGRDWAAQEMYACPHGRYATAIDTLFADGHMAVLPTALVIRVDDTQASTTIHIPPSAQAVGTEGDNE